MSSLQPVNPCRPVITLPGHGHSLMAGWRWSSLLTSRSCHSSRRRSMLQPLNVDWPLICLSTSAATSAGARSLITVTTGRTCLIWLGFAINARGSICGTPYLCFIKDYPQSCQSRCCCHSSTSPSLLCAALRYSTPSATMGAAASWPGIPVWNSQRGTRPPTLSRLISVSGE